MIFDRESDRIIQQYKVAYAKAYYSHRDFIKALELLPLDQQADFICSPNEERILEATDQQIHMVERSMARLKKWKARWVKSNDLPDIGKVYPMMKWEDINTVIQILIHEIHGVSSAYIAQQLALPVPSDTPEQMKWKKLVGNVVNVKHRLNCLRAFLKFQSSHNLIVNLSAERYKDFDTSTDQNRLQIDALGWSMPIHGGITYQSKKEAPHEWVIIYSAPPNPFNLMMVGREI